MKWLELRHALGRSSDRGDLLRFHSAVTGYEPWGNWRDAHLYWHDDPQDLVRKYCTGGFGGGKTEFEVHDLVMHGVGNPGGWHLFAAPSVDQAHYVLLPRFMQIMDMYAQAGYPLMKKWSGTPKNVAELYCGGKVFFRTFSKLSGLVGREFSGACIDELDTVRNARRVYSTVQSRIRQAINSRLIVVATTPDMGLEGAAGVWAAARRDETVDSRGWYWVRQDAQLNPHLPRGYHDGMRSTMSRREWEVLVEARILKPQTLVFPEFSKEHHHTHIARDSSLPYHLAYDAGDNKPAIAWVQEQHDGQLVVFDEICHAMPIGRLHDEVVRRCRLLGRDPEVIGADRHRTDEIAWCQHTFKHAYVERMERKSEQAVAFGVERVRQRLDPLDGEPSLLVTDKLWQLDRERRGTVNSFRSYRYKQNAEGNITNRIYKDDVHDHIMDALRYLVVGLEKRAGSTRTVRAPWGRNNQARRKPWRR